MRLFSRLATVLFLCIGLASTPAQAQNDTLRTQPGYVDFSPVDAWFDTDATVQIDLQGAVLKLVASASESSDPEFSDLVGNLEGIQVRGYPARGLTAETLNERTQELMSLLEDQGWQRALYVREGSESSYVYVRRDGDAIAGLTILSTDPNNESVFVNIVGSIRPEQIQKLGQELDIESLETLDTNPQG